MVSCKIYSALNSPRLSELLARSAYSLEEIQAVVAEAEQVGREHDDIAKMAVDALTWKVEGLSGQGMGWLTGYASDAHQELDQLLSDPFRGASISIGRTQEPFPVKSWRRDVAKMRRCVSEIKQALEALARVAA